MSETIALLGQDPAIRKIIVDNKCLQKINNFKHLGFEISYENKKKLNRLTKFAQIPEILNDC